MIAAILKVIVEFIEAVGEATLASVRAVIYLPRNIGQAIADYKHSQEIEAELEAALIDHCFLDRATTISPEESAKIKRLMKDFS